MFENAENGQPTAVDPKQKSTLLEQLRPVKELVDFLCRSLPSQVKPVFSPYFNKDTKQYTVDDLKELDRDLSDLYKQAPVVIALAKLLLKEKLLAFYKQVKDLDRQTQSFKQILVAYHVISKAEPIHVMHAMNLLTGLGITGYQLKMALEQKLPHEMVKFNGAFVTNIVKELGGFLNEHPLCKGSHNPKDWCKNHETHLMAEARIFALEVLKANNDVRVAEGEPQARLHFSV